jgi:4-amino-4-deoxy-L-arabinose transferase-like glycosyltransferase
MLKPILVIFGIVVAAVGGAIAYRALFLEPASAVLITNTEVRELPNYARVVGGVLLLIAGAAVAFFTAIRKK